MRDGDRRWRTIEHTADLAVELEASSPEELFLAAADALIGVLRGEEAASAGPEADSASAEQPVSEWRALSLEASDREALLVDWLRELLYLTTMTEPLFFAKGEIHALSETRIEARAAFTGATGLESVERELKGVTYHDLQLRRRGDSWYARIVFDV